MAGLPWGRYVATDVMWRCVGCGKWSHALRRPARHERFLKAELGAPEPDAYIDARYSQEPDTGAVVLDGWIISCGPFEKWVAERVPERQQA